VASFGGNEEKDEYGDRRARCETFIDAIFDALRCPSCCHGVEGVVCGATITGQDGCVSFGVRPISGLACFREVLRLDADRPWEEGH